MSAISYKICLPNSNSMLISLAAPQTPPTPLPSNQCYINNASVFKVSLSTLIGQSGFKGFFVVVSNLKLTYLTENRGRSCLVTCSKLDHKIFHTQWSFGMAVVGAFGGNTVNYFVVGKEEHQQPGSYH